MLLIALALSVDVHTISELQRLQQTLIARFLNINSRTDSLCTWKGIDCNPEGLVRSLFYKKKSPVLSLDFAPPSVYHLYAHHVPLAGPWHSARLPRELRFLHVWYCGRIEQRRLRYTIDFRKLPFYLEEMAIAGETLVGAIDFTELPRQMHLLLLHDVRSSSEKYAVHVDYGTLPVGIKIALTMRFDHKMVKIKRHGRTKKDDRLQIGMQREVNALRIAREFSKYERMFDEKLSEDDSSASSDTSSDISV